MKTTARGHLILICERCQVVGEVLCCEVLGKLNKAAKAKKEQELPSVVSSAFLQHNIQQSASNTLIYSSTSVPVSSSDRSIKYGFCYT